MTTRPIYLDYMATTPIDPRVIPRMIACMGPDANFGNPASIQHHYGQDAALAVEHARSQIATAVGADTREIVFTSGATESNNLAILGAARFYQRKGRHLITMTTEHAAVLDSFRQLEREGFSVSYIAPQADGLLNLSTLAEALRHDTILVSIMHVNNEIGVIQDVAAIGELLKNKGIVFHVDAAQSAGKLGIHLQDLAVSLMSFSGHKNYGPKGIGALYVRNQPRIRLQTQSFGGNQEGGLRSGTLAPHQIVGMGEAFALSETIRVEEQASLLKLRNKLWNGICQERGVQLNGSQEHRIAGNLNFSIRGIDGALLIPALHELAISSTSACAAASHQPSHVLQAIGITPELAQASIRLSLGRFTTESDVDRAINIICKQVRLLTNTRI